MSVTKGPNAVSSPSRTRRKALEFSLFIFSFFRCKNTSHIPLSSRPMPPGVVHFRNCTCANRSRVLACGATGLRVSGRSVLRTVPEAFTLRPRLGVRGCRIGLVRGRGVLHVDSSRAAPDFAQAGVEVLFAGRGSAACSVPAWRAGLRRGVAVMSTGAAGAAFSLRLCLPAVGVRMRAGQEKGKLRWE